MRAIHPGERSRAVEEVQAKLVALGFTIDDRELGMFGPATAAAVRGFQQRRGLDVDGVVGDATWRELHESSWGLGGRRLYLREPPLRGDDVRELQSQLNSLGFSAGKHDGIFGVQTAEAVREFQQNLAIGEDGIVGPATIKALGRLGLVLRKGLGPRVRERERRRSLPPGISGKRIAIDPGHGGTDAGHMSPSGESEAELVFHLAAAVARRLEWMGAAAVLTRGPNDGPDVRGRAAMANGFAADLLVSIHLNAHQNEAASGAASYFFTHDGVASEPGEYLAEAISEALVETGTVDCGTHGRNYPLMRETLMPAVVVEPCFITNPEEAKLLADDDSLELIAAAIANGIRRYFL